MNSDQTLIEFYADILCPWCYIAHRRLRSALTGRRDSTSTGVRWRSLELAPDLSRTPASTAAKQMAAETWWGEQAPARIAEIRALGAAEGLQLNLQLARPVNSFDAHRMVKLAACRDRESEVVESLLYSYHTEGLNIANHSVLEGIGTRAGLKRSDIRSMLASDAFGADVRADERSARDRGVAEVPSLVIGDGPPIKGMHSIAALHRLVDMATLDTSDVTTRNENP